MPREPLEPDNTCPYIDSAISEMEKVRKLNEKLREWGSYWKSQCVELENQISDNAKAHEEKISELKEEIEQLHHLLKNQD